MKGCENFIDGKFVPSDQEGQRISVFNPATEAEITQVPEPRMARVIG
jgi:acyl-CoA reductase-like NAD-dependent aldehyde dehydrogenase